MSVHKTLHLHKFTVWRNFRHHHPRAMIMCFNLFRTSAPSYSWSADISSSSWSVI